MQSKTSIFLLSNKCLYHPRIVREVLDCFKQVPQNYSLIEPKMYVLPPFISQLHFKLQAKYLVQSKMSSCEKHTFPFTSPPFREALRSFNPESDFTGLKFWICSTTQDGPFRKPETMTGIHSKFPHSTRHFWKALQKLRKQLLCIYVSEIGNSLLFPPIF